MWTYCNNFPPLYSKRLVASPFPTQKNVSNKFETSICVAEMFMGNWNRKMKLGINDSFGEVSGYPNTRHSPRTTYMKRPNIVSMLPSCVSIHVLEILHKATQKKCFRVLISERIA